MDADAKNSNRRGHTSRGRHHRLRGRSGLPEDRGKGEAPAGARDERPRDRAMHWGSATRQSRKPHDRLTDHPKFEERSSHQRVSWPAVLRLAGGRRARTGRLRRGVASGAAVEVLLLLAQRRIHRPARRPEEGLNLALGEKSAGSHRPQSSRNQKQWFCTAALRDHTTPASHSLPLGDRRKNLSGSLAKQAARAHAERGRVASTLSRASNCRRWPAAAVIGATGADDDCYAG